MKPFRQAQKWSYSSHKKSIGMTLSSPDIRSNKKTLTNCWYRVCERGSSMTSRLMEQHNDERCISHQPSKRNDATDGMLSHNGRSFYLARTALDPPTSPCKKLFPAIDEWHDRQAAKELSPDNSDPIQPTVSTNANAQVIMMLRKTFIQDSVLMTELHLCHRIWQYSIFFDPSYLSFKR
jgi:hypothetical protein